MVLVAFEGIATATVMPALAADLDALADYAWAFNAYILSSLIGMVVAGQIGDARGPRIPLMLGVATFATGALLAGLAPSLTLLVMGRALQGVGGGAVLVGLYIFIARAYPESMRPKAFSALSAAWVLPSLIGPLIAGWLAEVVSWRAVFLLVPIFVIPFVLVMVPRLSTYEREGGATPPRSRLFAGIIAAAGLLAIQDGLSRISVLGFIEAGLGLAVVGGCAPRLLPAGSLRLARGLPTTVMLRGVAAGAFFSAEAFIPLALVEVRGASVLVGGVCLGAGGVFWAVGSYLQSRLPGERDRSRAVRIGAVFITASLLAMPVIVLTDVPIWLSVPIWAVGAVGMGIAIPSISVQTMRLSPADQVGVSSSALQIVDSVMVVIAIATLGMVHAEAVLTDRATASTFALLWAMSAALAMVAVLAAPRMRPIAA
jgi:MFS family permease